jgi:hypothetical protein
VSPSSPSVKFLTKINWDQIGKKRPVFVWNSLTKAPRSNVLFADAISRRQIGADHERPYRLCRRRHPSHRPARARRPLSDKQALMPVYKVALLDLGHQLPLS